MNLKSNIQTLHRLSY